MSTIRKWSWTVLRLVILVFLITGVVDVIVIGGRTLFRTVRIYTGTTLSEPIGTKVQPQPTGDYSPYQYLDSVADVLPKTITYKRLHIDVDPTGVSASYDVYLPKDHRLFEIADGETDAQRLAHEVLGAVTVDGLNQFLKFERVETSIAATDDNAHIFVSSSRYRPQRDRFAISVRAKQRSLPLSIATKEVIVHTRNINLHSVYPRPISKTSDETFYVLPPNEDVVEFIAEVTNPAAIPPRDQTDGTLADLLKVPLRIPGDRIWYGFLASLPFLLFLYWNKLRGFAATDEHARLRVNAVKTYLIFHFSYFFFYGLNGLIDDWRSPFTWALNSLQSRTLNVFDAHDRNNSLIVPLMAMFLCVWPAFAQGSEPGVKTSRLRDRLVQILAILVLLVLLWLVGSLAVANVNTLTTQVGSLKVLDFYSLFFGAAALILFVLCLLLARAQTRFPRLAFSLCLFLSLVVLSVVEIFYDYGTNPNSPYRHLYAIVTLLIFVLAAFLIVRAFTSVFYQAITGRVLAIDRKAWSFKKRFLVNLLLLVIALSTPTWHWPMTWWQLWSLAWELRVLFLIALVWILADYLRRVSAEYDWLSLPESAREAGILLALSMFYSPTTRWKYIPVSFIAGYLVLRFWLLPEKQFDRSVFSQVKAGMIGMIERVIAFNDAERALKTLKKELLAKLGKGEIEPQQYTDKLQVQAKTVKALKKDLTIHKRFAKNLVLAFGPGNSAWENGRTVAFYSLLFSIPWSLLYLRDLARAPATFEGYLILDLLTGVILFIMTWLSYGFIFGYFYPHIRGNNGIQKGLALFLTIIVPDLIWTALALPLDRANWVSFGFWVLQIFVQTMLLGMIAGDFAIMRAHGFKWSQLLEFYRLSSLSAWASSVILAIAAAVSTLLTSGATQIITTAFKYMGVIHDDIPLPNK